MYSNFDYNSILTNCISNVFQMSFAVADQKDLLDPCYNTYSVLIYTKMSEGNHYEQRYPTKTNPSKRRSPLFRHGSPSL